MQSSSRSVVILATVSHTPLIRGKYSDLKPTDRKMASTTKRHVEIQSTCPTFLIYPQKRNRNSWIDGEFQFYFSPKHDRKPQLCICTKQNIARLNSGYVALFVVKHVLMAG